MKLKLTVCALLVAPLAIAQGEPNQQQKQKRFGDGTCLPKYLDHYDVDGDGVINTEEKQVMEQARDQIRKQLRKDWDKDGDGKICDKEKKQARTRLRAMMEETRLERFWEAEDDEDGDEGLSLTDPYAESEFGQLPGIANKLATGDPEKVALVEAIFDRLDADDDGLITEEEFMAAVRQCDQARDGSGDGSGGGGGGTGGNGGGGGGGS